MKEFFIEYKLYIIIGAFALYALVLLFFTIRKKKKDKQFEQERPDIAKVHFESGISARGTNKLHIFSEGMHTGCYLEEGVHTLYVSYYYEKMTKRVTVMEAPISITVEAYKEYELSYDRKKEQYIFVEK